MNSTRLVSAVIVSICFCACAEAATLRNFDDLATGDYGETLVYGDVTIKGQSGTHLEITDITKDPGWGLAHSLPNKLSVWGDAPLVKEKTSFLLDFNIPVNDMSFWLTGTFHDTTVTAYDSIGNPLETKVETYPTSGPTAPDGNPWDYYWDRQSRMVSMSSTGIAEMLIQPSAYDGFSIDDLNYTVTPEPATAALFLLGGGVLIMRRRKKKNIGLTHKL